MTTKLIVAAALGVTLVAGSTMLLGHMKRVRPEAPVSARGADMPAEVGDTLASTANPASTARSAGAGVASPGAMLGAISTPPSASLWAVPSEECASGTRIAVVFEPYGRGPSFLGDCVIVHVISADASPDSSGIPDLNGRDVVFLQGNSRVTTGGRYRATAITQERANAIVFVLDDVKPSD